MALIQLNVKTVREWVNLLNWLESIGRTVINGLSQMGSATLLVWHTIKQLK